MKLMTEMIGVSIIAFNGAQLTVTDGKDVPIGKIDLPQGPMRLDAYAPILELGIVSLTGAMILATNQGRVGAMKHGLRHKSGANAEFSPTGEYRTEREMKRMITELVNKRMRQSEKRRVEQQALREAEREALIETDAEAAKQAADAAEAAKGAKDAKDAADAAAAS